MCRLGVVRIISDGDVILKLSLIKKFRCQTLKHFLCPENVFWKNTVICKHLLLLYNISKLSFKDNIRTFFYAIVLLNQSVISFLCHNILFFAQMFKDINSESISVWVPTLTKVCSKGLSHAAAFKENGYITVI